MNFSTLCAGMNFNNLTADGYAAFILALIFSVVSIAGFIFFARHKDAGKVTSVLTTIIFPVIAIFFWVYLFMNIYEFDLAVSLGVAFGTSLGYAVVAICLALIINAIIKSNANKKVENETMATEESANIAEPVTEPVETSATETEETVEEETIEDEEQKLLNAPETEEPVALLEENKEEVEVVSEEVEEAENENIEETENTETTEEAKEEITEQGVIFSNEPKKTFDEQFAELDADRQGYFNEILEYAMEKQGAKCSNAKYHKTVKIGSMKLLDAKFSKESLLCNFMAGSSELKYYSKKEKNVKIKEKPVIIEIDSAESVPVAKNMIDIVFKNISEAKEELTEVKKAKRRKRKTTEEKPENTETEQPSENNESNE